MSVCLLRLLAWLAVSCLIILWTCKFIITYLIITQLFGILNSV